MYGLNVSPLIHVCLILTTVQAQVISSYETSLEGELRLKVGDVVHNIRITKTRYWSGILKGKRGHFPKDRVKLLSEGVFYSMYVTCKLLFFKHVLDMK